MKKKLLFILGFIICVRGIYWFIHYNSKETTKPIEKKQNNSLTKKISY